MKTSKAWWAVGLDSANNWKKIIFCFTIKQLDQWPPPKIRRGLTFLRVLRTVWNLCKIPVWIRIRIRIFGAINIIIIITQTDGDRKIFLCPVASPNLDFKVCQVWNVWRLRCRQKNWIISVNKWWKGRKKGHFSWVFMHFRLKVGSQSWNLFELFWKKKKIRVAGSIWIPWDLELRFDPNFEPRVWIWSQFWAL